MTVASHLTMDDFPGCYVDPADGRWVLGEGYAVIGEGFPTANIVGDCILPMRLLDPRFSGFSDEETTLNWNHSGAQARNELVEEQVRIIYETEDRLPEHKLLERMSQRTFRVLVRGDFLQSKGLPDMEWRHGPLRRCIDLIIVESLLVTPDELHARELLWLEAAATQALERNPHRPRRVRA